MENSQIHDFPKGIHHHHHVVLVAQISLTLSRHFSLSCIASGRSSGQHPVSSHSCWAVREKHALVKTASKNYQKTPTNTNAWKSKTAQYQLAGIYIKKQTEYIQNQIDKIRVSVEDRQSRIAWQTINEVSRRKSTAKAKLKAANQQERIKLWKQHFENLLGNPPKIIH